MSSLRNFPFHEIAARGSIKETDAAELRRMIYADGVISGEEAEHLIDLNAKCPIKATEWSEVFQDAMTDYLVRQAEPQGYVTKENADWLISRLAPQGKLHCRADVELIIEIVDAARWSPNSLIEFALKQVAEAVRTGEGPLRSEGKTGTIDDGEVELVRRMIYAFGGDGNVAVSRAEAEMLCEINDSLDPEIVNDAWTELFVKAMANFILANQGYAVPSREEALRSEAWLDSRGDLSPQEIVRSITRLSLDDIFSAYRKQSIEECTLARLDREYREILTGEDMNADEAAWLAERLGRDGVLTPAEQSLIAYIKENATEIDPRFDDLLARHLDAA